jgi:carbon-monoxide dehydrogenase medium subunit
VRARGTLGGSVANNDPAACYPSAVLGLNATVITNQREIAADAFFVGMYTTALEEGEIITAIRFPIPQRAAYLKFRQPASRFSLVGVFVAQTDGGVRVAVTGAASCVFRHAGLEAALNQSFTPQSAAAVRVDASDLNADIHASAAYRANLISVQTQRAVAQMLG